MELWLYIWKDDYEVGLLVSTNCNLNLLVRGLRIIYFDNEDVGAQSTHTIHAHTHTSHIYTCVCLYKIKIKKIRYLKNHKNNFFHVYLYYC